MPEAWTATHREIGYNDERYIVRPNVIEALQMAHRELQARDAK